ncbi:MAG: hypothetical protein P8101_00125 [Candidatus Thiodiazotropha sp.]
MKRFILIFTINLFFTAIGYLIGTTGNTPTTVISSCEDTPNLVKGDTKEEPVVEVIDNTPPHENPGIQANNNDDDIGYLISSTEADDRMNALFFIWRTNLVNAFTSEINNLANTDKNTKINSFAKWILEFPDNQSLRDKQQAAIAITDSNDLELQLKNSLAENTHETQQLDQNLSANSYKITKINQLSKEEQLSYVKELSHSQEDSAIKALCELVLNYEPNIKNAAINELFSLLESHTGHFDIIMNSLQGNQGYLNTEQLDILNLLSAGNSHQETPIDTQSLDKLDVPM